MGALTQINNDQGCKVLSNEAENILGSEEEVVSFYLTKDLNLDSIRYVELALENIAAQPDYLTRNKYKSSTKMGSKTVDKPRGGS